MRIGIQRLRRAGVAEALGELDWPDPLLVPEACSPMTERMRAEAASVRHGGPESVPAYGELETLFERIREHFGDGDYAPVSLTLADLSTDAEFASTEILWHKGKRLRHTEPPELHHHDRQHQVRAEAGE